MQFRVCLGEEGPEIQSQGGHGHGNRWVKVPETIFKCLMRTRNSPAGVPEEEEKVAVLTEGLDPPTLIRAENVTKKKRQIVLLISSEKAILGG